MSAARVDFAAVKQRTSLTELLRHYRVEGLRRSGPHRYRGRCPIHCGEGRETFHADLGRNLFHCFSCGAGGTVLDFVAAMERTTIRDAALRLRSPGEGASPRTPAVSREVGEKRVTKRNESNPELGFTLELDPRHPYLAGRGFDDATARRFGAGYCGRGLMRGRIALPIHNHEGRLVAYAGRAVEAAVIPRYRFPAGFRKSLVLYHYHRARAAAGEDRLILVEGFFDCWRVTQAGYAAVAALMGATLSPAQRELAAAFRRVVLLLDGDDAGRAAAARIARELEPVCAVTVVRLPLGVQPDQLPPVGIRHFLDAAERRIG